jgi:cytoskeleton protein RodZ
MVENFGSYLKHERELRGVPLEEISGATKIHIRYLKALEENSFDELPGEVFIKGYIRSYANIIGSDVEEMLNIYEESMELKRQENVPQETSSFNAHPKALLAYGLLILAVIGLLFGVGYLIRNGMVDSSEKSELNKAPKHEINAEVAEPPIGFNPDLSAKQLEEEAIDVSETDFSEAETPVQGSINPINPPEHSVSEEGVREETIPASQELAELPTQSPSASLPDLDSQKPVGIEKPLKLLIRTKEISWFNMTIDDFREEDFILPAGTSKIFWGNEKIRLTVGNKTGVKLVLNDKTLTLPESKDKVVKDFIINSKLVD